MERGKDAALKYVLHELFVRHRIETLAYWLALVDSAGIGYHDEGGDHTFDLYHWLHAYRTARQGGSNDSTIL